METGSIPPQFDEQFLDWFRVRTEAHWATLPQQTPEEVLAQFMKAGVGGSAWQPDTCWLGGLRGDEIAAIEEQWNLRFPPDYRLFLRHLHSVNKPTLHASYITKEELAAPDADRYLATAVVHNTAYMVLSEGAPFYNWQTDVDALNNRFAWLWDGLQFDVEHADLWLDSWGERPTNLDEQKQRVYDLVLAAPKLIPIFGHRYLLAEPCSPNNPVFSVYQSDIIIYGANLRDYLIAEFGENMLGQNLDDYHAVQKEIQERISVAYDTALAIPFWGELR